MQSKQGNVILILKQKEFQGSLEQFEIVSGKKAIYIYEGLQSHQEMNKIKETVMNRKHLSSSQSYISCFKSHILFCMIKIQYSLFK